MRRSSPSAQKAESGHASAQTGRYGTARSDAPFTLRVAGDIAPAPQKPAHKAKQAKSVNGRKTGIAAAVLVGSGVALSVLFNQFSKHATDPHVTTIAEEHTTTIAKPKVTIDTLDPVLTQDRKVVTTIISKDDMPPVTVVDAQAIEAARLAELERKRIEEARLERERFERERQRLERERLAAEERKAEAERDRIAKIEAAPLCGTENRGGNKTYKYFRSAAQMKELGIKPETVLAYVEKQGCKVTLDSAFADSEISRIPFIPGATAGRNKQLFDDWKACFAKVGHLRTHFRSAALDKGLAFAPSEISELESARGRGRGYGYDCSVSWGRDRVDDDAIAARIKKKQGMPQGDWGGAMGPYQFMHFSMTEYGVENPFDREEAAQGARLYSRALQRIHGNDGTKVRIAYNGGSGAVYKAEKTCGSKEITAECVGHRQTRGYAFPKKTRGKKDVEVAEGNNTGGILGWLLKGGKKKPATPALSHN